MRDELRTVRVGLIFSLLALLFGFGMGIAFGAAEDTLKDGLRASAAAVVGSVYADPAVADPVVKKSWTYMKRAHLHAIGLGTAALLLSLLLAWLPGPARLRQALAILAGAGGLGYGLFWLFAGLLAPGLGSTGAAKESLAWLAVPTSAACVLAAFGVAVLVVRALFGGPTADSILSSPQSEP